MNSINQNIENQLDNLDLSDASRIEAALNVELAEEPKQAYEIFKSLENVILYSEDDDESDIFTPSIDGEPRSSLDTAGNWSKSLTHFTFFSF